MTVASCSLTKIFSAFLLAIAGTTPFIPVNCQERVRSKVISKVLLKKEDRI